MPVSSTEFWNERRHLEPLAHTQVQAACYPSICMTGGFIHVENTHSPEIFTHGKTQFLITKPTMQLQSEFQNVPRSLLETARIHHI